MTITSTHRQHFVATAVAALALVQLLALAPAASADGPAFPPHSSPFGQSFPGGRQNGSSSSSHSPPMPIPSWTRRAPVASSVNAAPCGS
jgi:hypothetical protein